MWLRQGLCLDPERNQRKKESHVHYRRGTWIKGQESPSWRLWSHQRLGQESLEGWGSGLRAKSHSCEELWDRVRTGPWGKTGDAKSQGSSFRKMTTVREGESQTWLPSWGSFLPVVDKSGQWLRVRAIEFWVLLANQTRWKDTRAHEPQWAPGGYQRKDSMLN